MIHVFRHGAIDGPAALYGKTDVGLSEEGLESLYSATKALRPPELIVTSPLQRCSSFAKLQAASLGSDLSVEDDLREMDFGQWDGVPYCKDSPLWPSMELFWQQPAIVTPPGGESLEQMQHRVARAWYALLEVHRETTWVFAHGGVIRLILAELLGLDWRNASLYSNLQVAYASRTDITYQQFDGMALTRVQAVAVPAPAISTTQDAGI